MVKYFTIPQSQIFPSSLLKQPIYKTFFYREKGFKSLKISISSNCLSILCEIETSDWYWPFEFSFSSKIQPESNSFERTEA